MYIKPIPLLMIGVMLIAGCSRQSTSLTEAADSAASTQTAAGTATAMMAEVRHDFETGQTATAAVKNAVEEALTTAVAAAVAETLTAVLPAPSDTPPPTDSPTETPVNSPTYLPSETPTTPPTLTQVPLFTPTVWPACYQVMDNWCSTHQGCATVDVRNQSGLDSNWHIWSGAYALDVTFTIPPGPCTLVTRPGKYNFYITYCDGEVADFSWQLNDNWWYKISPCE